MLALITIVLALLLVAVVAVVAQGGRGEIAVKVVVCLDEKWLEAKPRK